MMSEFVKEHGSNAQDTNTSDNGVSLWMERGYSRREIAARMVTAAPGLKLFTSPEQSVPNTENLAFPAVKSAADIEVLNKLIAAYSIDAIWPQKSARYDLSGVNAEVHAAATPEVIELVDNKARFAAWLGDDPLRADATEVIGVEGVAAEYTKRNSEGREVCVKPVIGVNGQGYWRLTDAAGALFLNKPEEHSINPNLYFDALALQEAESGPQQWLVMEYLPGPEVSIDLLCWRSLPLIHAVRTKYKGANFQRVQSDHPLVDHVYSAASRLALHGIVNMQYRLDADQNWKMLEINPRPAGGSIHSEDAGFGIISNWAKLVNREADPSTITQVSADVILESARVATITPTSQAVDIAGFLKPEP